MEDSAVLDYSSEKIVFTTDSFVVDPIFFPGGDIGKLSVCGTINDLSTTGCTPVALSLAIILEEGFLVSHLKKILLSIKHSLKEANVKVVTGDTKVVEKGNIDKIYINTSGIGVLNNKINISPLNIKVGDKILLNGGIGEHGLSVLSQRKEFDFKTSLESDCAPLNSLVSDMLNVSKNIHAIRDVTRGGLATILVEMAKSSNTSIAIHQDKIPIKREVVGICEFLGLDPLYIANEGKIAVFVDKDDAEKVLQSMRKNKYGRGSQIIGEVTDSGQGMVVLNTTIGTKRILDMHYSKQLPRIC